MNLEEVKQAHTHAHDVTFLSIAAKKQESAKLAEQMAAWEAAGGKVDVLSSTKSVDYLINELTGTPDTQRKKTIEAHNKRQREASQSFGDGKNRATKQSKYGQNITKTRSGRLAVKVGLHYKEFVDPKDAVTFRDWAREKSGLPTAEY